MLCFRIILTRPVPVRVPVSVSKELKISRYIHMLILRFFFLSCSGCGPGSACLSIALPLSLYLPLLLSVATPRCSMSAPMVPTIPTYRANHSISEFRYSISCKRPLGKHKPHMRFLILRGWLCGATFGIGHLLFTPTHTYTLTVTCACCCDEIKRTHDLKICSHADSLLLCLLPSLLLCACVSVCPPPVCVTLGCCLCLLSSV